MSSTTTTTTATFTNLTIKARTDFDEYYEFGSEIGKGRYASVKKCFCKATRQCYAAKVIKNFRSKNSKLNMNIVENEITALSLTRSHPSIVNLYEVFYHKGETILILEYATEKDLHIYLDCEGAFEEAKACNIVYQVLKAVEFLHSKHILHLDIKPENVLLMNPMPTKATPSPGSKTPDGSDSENAQDESEPARNDEKSKTASDEPIKVKLCDFSFSQIMMPGKNILGMMGTIAYSAPEVIQYDALTKATDMWSLGVLTHVLLTEYTPFGNGTEKHNQTETNILNVKNNEFKCTEEYFEDISDEAKNFIESLIKFKPKQRLTVEEALNHRWFNKFGVSSDSAVCSESSSPVASSQANSSVVFTSEQADCLSIDLSDETVSSCSTTTPNGTTTTTTTKSTTNTKLIEIKDDKNNNSLSSLVETVVELIATPPTSEEETTRPFDDHEISLESIPSFVNSKSKNTSPCFTADSSSLVSQMISSKSVLGSLIEATSLTISSASILSSGEGRDYKFAKNNDISLLAHDNHHHHHHNHNHNHLTHSALFVEEKSKSKETSPAPPAAVVVTQIAAAIAQNL